VTDAAEEVRVERVLDVQVASGRRWRERQWRSGRRSWRCRSGGRRSGVKGTRKAQRVRCTFGTAGYALAFIIRLSVVKLVFRAPLWLCCAMGWVGARVRSSMVNPGQAKCGEKRR